ncbi:HTH-type transcriptional activator Btr [compost metagenome]
MVHFESMMKQYSQMVSGVSPVQRALAYIHDHLDQSLSLSQVAKHVHMNPNYFSEVFKRETGQNYIEFVTQAKLRKAMTLLRETPAKISEVAYQIGYEDIKHFNRLFKKFTGLTPSEYRSKS